MATEYKYSFIRKKFLQFCRKNNINPQELLSCCEGRVSNFPFWYVDYQRYIQNEIKNRVRTGVVTKFNYRDVWS